MRASGRGQMWFQYVAAAFLGLTTAVAFAVTGGSGTGRSGAESSSSWAPPAMHEAQAGVDVGPGSDEALLVSSPGF